LESKTYLTLGKNYMVSERGDGDPPLIPKYSYQ